MSGTRPKALLLSAGLGTRLKPYTDFVPKCLMPVGDRPILDWWIHRLVDSGISEILVNTHYKSDLVNSYLENHPSRRFLTVVHEDILLGTAGTLKRNRQFFGNDPVLMVHGDNFSSLNIKKLCEHFFNRPPECHLTMATFETDAPETCGIVEIDSRNIVQGFYEKVKNPPGNLANAAVYIFDTEVFKRVISLEGDVLDFSTQILPSLIGQMNVSPVDGYHIDIGSAANWHRANEVAKELSPAREPSHSASN